MVNWRTELLTLVEAYCKAVNRSESRVATLAVNEGLFFTRIRKGGGCNVDTLIKVKRWFVDNWPSDHAWPEGIDRTSDIRDLPAAEVVSD